jgi:hypothetical protein
LDRLLTRLEAEDFRGYDPYDILLSPVPFRLFGTYGAAVATQLHKRNPVNLRPMLGIRKAHHPKAMGLLLYVYSRLQQLHPDRDYSRQLERIFSTLKEQASKGYHGACWGYHFGWASPGKFVPAFAPNAVVTAFVVKGLHAYWQVSGHAETKALILSAVDFVVQDLQVYEDATGCCFSYTPFKRDLCYNASLLAAEILARGYDLSHDPALKEKALSACRFVLSRQQPDGRWNYSQDPATGQEREQVDFHQGFVLDSLEAVQELTGTALQSGAEAVRRGLSFYRHHQFFSDGRSKWRYPKSYPADIHHQAQGIITFSRHDSAFSKIILDWTLKHLFDHRKPAFYYRKYSCFTDRTNYIRWGDAWMAVALTELVSEAMK